jgi:hypothetical protein
MSVAATNSPCPFDGTGTVTNVIDPGMTSGIKAVSPSLTGLVVQARIE